MRKYWRPYNDGQIADLLVDGFTPKQVAFNLKISVWTVYRANKRAKFWDEIGGLVSRENAPKLHKKTY